MTPRKTLVTPVVVSKEFSSSFVTKNHNKKATKKKDDDDKDADEMKTFMQMFIMQSERERADREYEREERRRQAEIDREERRLQMAQTKAQMRMLSTDCICVLLHFNCCWQSYCCHGVIFEHLYHPPRIFIE